jgi:hypothetical protein
MADLAMFFRLNVEHTYFRSRKNINLGFRPVGLTVLLISKYIVYFLERGNGFELYADLDRLKMLYEYLQEEETDHLEFIMDIKDRDFLNYTELDISPGSFMLLRNPDKDIAAGEVLALHQDDFVSENDLAALSSEAALNIPGELFLKPDSLALIQVPLRKKGDDIELVDGNGKLISSAGIIKFQARSTFWKYIFISKEDPQFDSMQVVDSTGQITFSKMVVEDGPEGSLTYVAESDATIPLREISDHQFQLKGTQNGTEHTIIQRLAAPNPDYLSRVNGKLFSTIFIYY